MAVQMLFFSDLGRVVSLTFCFGLDRVVFTTYRVPSARYKKRGIRCGNAHAHTIYRTTARAIQKSRGKYRHATRGAMGRQQDREEMTVLDDVHTLM